MCQDFATESGYEYIYGLDTTGKDPWIGDGALLAEFSDGVRTGPEWKAKVVTHGCPPIESCMKYETLRI